jgi:RNA polymerase sigma-70 factor (ECF subfamily)
MKEQEFQQLYREHSPRLAAFLARRVDPGDVEDLAAEVIEIAWRKRSSASAEAYLGWLFGIAANVVANFRRKHKRRSAIERLLLPAESAPSAEQIALTDGDLANAWAQLSARDRQVLALAYIDEMPHGVIATSLGVSTNAVAIRLHRAKRKLEILLDQERNSD